MAKIYFDCPINIEVSYRNGNEPFIELRRAIIARDKINLLISHIIRNDEVFLKLQIKDKTLLAEKLKEKNLI